MPNTLYMTIGLPASGKTTWRREHQPHATVISPDAVLEERWGYDWQHSSDAWAICNQALSHLGKLDARRSA